MRVPVVVPSAAATPARRAGRCLSLPQLALERQRLPLHDVKLLLQLLHLPHRLHRHARCQVNHLGAAGQGQAGGGG